MKGLTAGFEFGRGMVTLWNLPLHIAKLLCILFLDFGRRENSPQGSLQE